MSNAHPTEKTPQAQEQEQEHEHPAQIEPLNIPCNPETLHVHRPGIESAHTYPTAAPFPHHYAHRHHSHRQHQNHPQHDPTAPQQHHMRKLSMHSMRSAWSDVTTTSTSTYPMRRPSPTLEYEEETRAERKEREKRNFGFPKDVLVVDWEEGDVGNPKNWPTRKKWKCAIVVSLFTFVSPIASAMIAPASTKLGHDFGITSESVLAMTTSIFVLGFAFGPFFLGPLSEIYGRAKVLQISNLVFLAFNTGCGFAQNTAQILVFRFLAGVAGGAPLSIGGGVLSDMFTPETRGQAVAIYSLMPMLGPVVGPIAGAWIAQKTTWRWVYWSSSLIDLPIQALGVLFLRETFAPLLLSIRARKIRASLDPEKDGYSRVMTVYDQQDRSWQSLFKTALSRPLRFFATESIVQLFGLYMAFVYGLMYLFLVTIPHMFRETYNMSLGISGLHYIALGIGLTGTSQINSRMYDKIYKYLKEKYQSAGRPEFRLPSMVPGTFLLPAGLLITGWTAECKTHWIAVDIGIGIVGAGIVLNMQTIQIYIIDAFTLYSASALAAVNFLRAIFGFSFPLFSQYMYQRLGFGKGDTILAACAIAIGCPAPWVFWKYGERIRERSRFTRRRQEQPAGSRA